MFYCRGLYFRTFMRSPCTQHCAMGEGGAGFFFAPTGSVGHVFASMHAIQKRDFFRFASSYKLWLCVAASFTLCVRCLFVCCFFCWVKKAHMADADGLPRGLTTCTHGAAHCDVLHANSVCHAASLSNMKEAKQGAECGKSGTRR